MSEHVRLRLGTRDSALARWQANWVRNQLEQVGVEVELVPITTLGDRQQQGPIGQLGDQGVFTKRIQETLLEKQIDLAVHSMKDLPTEPIEGLVLAAVPERGPLADVLVCREKIESLDALEEGALVGTGSMRRKTQLLHRRADLQIKPIRGNVDTRLRKLDSGEYQAIVLAEAGLRRLELADRISLLLAPPFFLPAVGQGALALEIRAVDESTREAIAPLDHGPTHAIVCAERAMLFSLAGGCLAPVAVWGRSEKGSLTLTGRVLSPNGAEQIESSLSGSWQHPDRLGHDVAQQLLAQGAAAMIQASREATL